MARGLENYPNVEAADSDYPSGRIKDNDGTGNGTPLSEEVYGDLHQFLAKILREAGVTPNEQPENEYSGHQYFDALVAVVRATAASESEKGTIEIATQAEVNTGTDSVRAVTPDTLATRLADAISAAIADLVDSSPSTLDTLNELAAALGDDPNFATTVTNSLATKAAKTQAAWQDISLINGWATDGDLTPQYMKDEFGFVHLRGRLDASASTGSQFAVLPSGYRPGGVPPGALSSYFPAAATNGTTATNKHMIIAVTSNTGGASVTSATYNTDSNPSLDGIIFDTRDY